MSEGLPTVVQRITVEKLISAFLRARYSVSMRGVYSKMRAPLLEDLEHVACNLCGADEPIALAGTDKYGLAVSTVMCGRCGLIYLNPRPTAAAYERFYVEGSTDEGVYHIALGFDHVESLLKRHFGPDFRMMDSDRKALRVYVRNKYEALFGESPGEGLGESEIAAAVEARARADESWEYEVYALDLYEYLHPHVKRGAKIFEAGASWGKLLVPWRDMHGCEVTGLEPREATVATARERLGIELYQGFPATAPVPENTYDVVMNIRTINHMIDPLGDLRHAWRWLKPGGIIFVDISDAIRETYYEGLETNVVEIDHTYMFSAATLAAMAEKAGFEVLQTEIVDTRHVFHGAEAEKEHKQIRLVARKTEHAPDIHWPDPKQELAELLQGQLHREAQLYRQVKALRASLKSVKANRKRERKAPADSSWTKLSRLIGSAGNGRRREG